MQRDDTQTIRYRPDGSIDTAYYMQIGRQERSGQAHKLAKSVLPKPRRVSARLWPRGILGT